MAAYRLIITDDDYGFREVLKILLEKKEDLEVIGEASDGGELVDLLSSNEPPPDLIILDISMSIMTGLEAASIIKMKYPKVRILILSHHDQKELVDEAVALGVDGYLTKGDLAVNLFSAIDSIRQGETYFSTLLKGRCSV